MRAERTHLPGTYHAPVGPIQREPTGLGTLWRIVRDMNPSGNTVNCGHSVDVVINRLRGTNPTAVSHNIGLAGTFEEIATRHGTVFTWGHSLDEIYHLIQSGGHGTIALLGIIWTSPSSHIVAIANVDGAVGVCEGQEWAMDMPPEVVADMAKAKSRYNPTGGETFGLAMVRWGCPARSGWQSSHTDIRVVQPCVPHHNR